MDVGEGGGVAGLMVLPFAWINLFTCSEQEAFQAIFQHFLFELQRDHWKCVRCVFGKRAHQCQKNSVPPTVAGIEEALG